MKINSLLFTVWMLFLTIPMVAQQPDARDILDRAADAFRREGGVKITFSVRAPEGNTNGSIRLKGDKFLLETEGVTTWFDGRTQWSYLDRRQGDRRVDQHADEPHGHLPDR